MLHFATFLQLKLEETELKTELSTVSNEYQNLVGRVGGLMGNDQILGDYSKTAEEVATAAKSLVARPVVPPLTMERDSSSTSGCDEE